MVNLSELALMDKECNRDLWTPVNVIHILQCICIKQKFVTPKLYSKLHPISTEW